MTPDGMPVRDAGRDPVAAIVDVGRFPVSARDCARAIGAIADGRAAELARDRNSTCYVVRWAGGAGPAGDVVVKVPRLGDQRTNPDHTFAGEAAMLARLPATGIGNASQLVARVVAGGRHYLFVTHLEGDHPDPIAAPLAPVHLAALLDSFAAMERKGLLHYDLKPANILVRGDAVAFLDFEFARFEPDLDVYAPSRHGFCDDFNVSGNPHFPARTNVANFEFRTLHRYCEGLRTAESAAAAERFFVGYLVRRANYHAARAEDLAARATADADRIAARAALAADEARRRLAEAAAYERLRAELLAAPSAEVAAIEWAVIAFRRDVFDRREAEARRLRRDILARLAAWRAVAGPKVLPYLHATAATVASIARSRIPGGKTASVDFGGDV
jgi:predicted Ser/Thr protein kinase